MSPEVSGPDKFGGGGSNADESVSTPAHDDPAGPSLTSTPDSCRKCGTTENVVKGVCGPCVDRYYTW